MRAGFRRASQVRIWLALIVLWAAAVPAFAQTDSDINGNRTPHGFAVSDGDTVKFGKQLIRLFGIDAPEKLQSWGPNGQVLSQCRCLTSRDARIRSGYSKDNNSDRLSQEHGRVTS